ncbi:hypothetical protein [Legionella sp. PC997]|uniref:hypothetical protein n=1 Tax=Legionella sp. PC997 TaxID=2755562 RepID=UPI0015FDE0A1|nr:hypothetical protein [Legionella sp. PC997]QMT59778.1 hypothetical protein HBNCFIEN_01145 [Legionella sp. PC997]
MWSPSQKNPSKGENERYARFIGKHRDLRNVIGGVLTVDLDRAQRELAKLEQIIQIIEEHKHQPSGDLREKLKTAMEYGNLTEKLKSEKLRAEEAADKITRLPLSLDEMKLLSSVFGSEDNGILYLSPEKFFERLENLQASTNEGDQKIVAKLEQKGQGEANRIIQDVIKHIKEDLNRTKWDEMKFLLSDGIKNVANYSDKTQIYNKTLFMHSKMDAEITQLSSEKTSQSSIGRLRQKKAAISEYIQELESIRHVESKYFTALTTTTARATTSLESDLKAIEKTIKECKKDIKEAKKEKQSTKFLLLRLKELESSKKVLSSLAKKGKLEKAIEEIEDALTSSQKVKHFDDVLEELDKNISEKEEQKALLMSDSPLSNKKEERQTKFEQNKREIAKLMASLDAVKVEGKIITKEEKKKWEDIEKRIDKLMYENDLLKSDNPPKSNEEIIHNLKDSMRITLALSEGKDKKTQEKATSYFKSIKQTIKEMREEDENLNPDHGYSLKK